MAVTVPELMKMSQAQLDELFSSMPAGPIPTGEAEGTAIIAPGTTYPGHREVHQPLRMAGKSVRSRARRAAKSITAFRPARDHCESL